MLLRTTGAPTHASWRDGHWYWIEQRDPSHAALVTDGSGAPRDVAQAEQITDYSVSGGGVLFISKAGSLWKITAQDSAGKATELASGPDPLSGPYLAGNAAYWLAMHPAPVANAAGFPPLASSIDLMACGAAGGPGRLVSTMLEPEGMAVLGIHDNLVYVLAHRPGMHGVSAIYTAPVNGGPAVRVAGETGQQSALLTAAGDLYWSAPSREAQNFDHILCIRHRSPDGKLDMLTDWLPSRGALYQSGGSLVYVDGDYIPAAWPISNARALPEKVDLPGSYCVLAVGDGDLLLRRADEKRAGAPIYRFRLK